MMLKTNKITMMRIKMVEMDYKCLKILIIRKKEENLLKKRKKNRKFTKNRRKIIYNIYQTKIISLEMD